MAKKLLGFIIALAINGFIALFLAFFLTLSLSIFAWLLQIPIGIMANKEISDSFIGLIDEYCTYRVMYTLSFIYLMAKFIVKPREFWANWSEFAIDIELEK